ncbi:hypothetical protein Peur_010811 [Populus x canadensis]
MRIGNKQFLERPTNLKHQPNFMREKNMSCPSQKPQLSQVMIDDKPTQNGRVHLMHNHDNDNNLHVNDSIPNPCMKESHNWKPSQQQHSNNLANHKASRCVKEPNTQQISHALKIVQS